MEGYVNPPSSDGLGSERDLRKPSPGLRDSEEKETYDPPSIYRGPLSPQRVCTNKETRYEVRNPKVSFLRREGEGRGFSMCIGVLSSSSVKHDDDDPFQKVLV